MLRFELVDEDLIVKSDGGERVTRPNKVWQVHSKTPGTQRWLSINYVYQYSASHPQSRGIPRTIYVTLWCNATQKVTRQHVSRIGDAMVPELLEQAADMANNWLASR